MLLQRLQRGQSAHRGILERQEDHMRMAAGGEEDGFRAIRCFASCGESDQLQRVGRVEPAIEVRIDDEGRPATSSLGRQDEKLKRALCADLDEAAWSTLYSTVSRPFAPPETGRIAVKVINHYGDEVLKVYDVVGEGT